MSVLKDLYNGRLCPIERMIPKNQKYPLLCKEIDREKAYFTAKLSEADKRRYKKLQKLIDECELMTEYTNFVQGFRLGLIIAFEMCRSLPGAGKRLYRYALSVGRKLHKN